MVTVHSGSLYKGALMENANKTKKKISRVITVRLFIAVFAAFLVSSAVTYNVLYSRCEEKAEELLTYSYTALVMDMKSSIEGELSNWYAEDINLYASEGEEAFRELLEGTSYSYAARNDGTIYLSGNESFIGKNIRDIQYVSSMMDDLLTSGRDAGREV